MKTIAVLGDSLTTGFYVSALIPTILRIRRRLDSNWFYDKSGDINSVQERCATLEDIRFISLARASAQVVHEERTSLLDVLLGVHHFESQVDRWLALDKVPDITLIWLGHNDLDWVAHQDAAHPKRLSSVKGFLTERFEASYLAQLQRMLQAGDTAKSGRVIITCGLVNFQHFFEARRKAEQMKQTNSALYPYLERDYDLFPSMKPEFRDGMIELSLAYNNSIRRCVHSLSQQPSGLELVYSSALHDVDISDVTSLSEFDAWHPSRAGHRSLAVGGFAAIVAHLTSADA